MGQRLNIEIRNKKSGEALANCYYHWSAYTEPSLRFAIEILNNLYEIVGIQDKSVTEKIKAIQLLQSTGAGVDWEEYDELTEDERPYCSLAINRNLGLISFTESSMEAVRTYAEREMIVNVDFEEATAEIDFSVFYEVGEDDDVSTVELDIDVHHLTTKDIQAFLRNIPTMTLNNGYFRLQSEPNKIYGIIY